jgi:hypothetical protein
LPAVIQIIKQYTKKPLEEDVEQIEADYHQKVKNENSQLPRSSFINKKWVGPMIEEFPPPTTGRGKDARPELQPETTTVYPITSSGRDPVPVGKVGTAARPAAPTTSTPPM